MFILNIDMGIIAKLKAQNLKSHGFTLIELLIVIAILGVLAAAVLVAINPGQKINASKNSRVRSDVANIGKNALLFNTDSGLAASCTGGASYPNAFAQTACSATFLAAVKDPGGTNYALSTSPASCAPNSTTPCTGFAVSGPAYSDGTIDASTNNLWCWKASTGSVTQAAACAAP